ncbi:MAG: hypothetical protein IPH72_01205 [Sandaracinaceae bacterium]|nr:hypothetical protein [Sandaracinaceae bacterium]
MTEGPVSRRGRVLEIVLVSLLPSLLTLGRFRNGFVFDDVFVIVRGEFIHTPARFMEAFTRHTMVASSQDGAVGQPALDTYRPMPLVTFFWDAWLAGRDTWSYHLTNTVLHALVCVGLLELVRRLAPGLPSLTRVSLVCVFALSPWLSEAHVWINGRSDPLMSLFLLLALHAGFARPSRASRAVVFAGCLLALLSKEVAVLALPFVVLVPWLRADSPPPRTARAFLSEVAGPAMALGVYLALRVNALHGLKTHEGSGQLLTAARHAPLLMVEGVYRTLVPSDYGLRSLRDDYAGLGAEWVAGACLVCLALAALAFRTRRQAPLLGAGLAWYALTIAPVSLISTALWPGFGRYLYLPALGLVLALGAGLQLVAETRPALRRMALGLPVILAVLSAPLLVFATTLYHDEATLYSAAQERAPEQAWTHGFLGLSLRRAGDCERAIPLLERAAQLDPADPRYLTHLGHCLVETRRREAALAVALQGEARFAGTRQEAAFLLIHASSLPTPDTDEMERLLRRCIAVYPGRTDCALGLETLRARRTSDPRQRGDTP